MEAGRNRLIRGSFQEGRKTNSLTFQYQGQSGGDQLNFPSFQMRKLKFDRGGHTAETETLPLGS